MMKKETCKSAAIFNYLAAICFYIVAIIKVVNGNESPVMYICLGTAFVVLGVVDTVVAKKKNNEDEK